MVLPLLALPKQLLPPDRVFKKYISIYTPDQLNLYYYIYYDIYYITLSYYINYILTCTCIDFHPGRVEPASSRASTAYRCLCCSLKKILWDLTEGRVPSPTQKNALFTADVPQTHWQSDPRLLVAGNRHLLDFHQSLKSNPFSMWQGGWATDSARAMPSGTLDPGRATQGRLVWHPSGIRAATRLKRLWWKSWKILIISLDYYIYKYSK